MRRALVLGLALMVIWSERSLAGAAGDSVYVPRDPAVYADALVYEYNNVNLTHLMMQELAGSTDGPVQRLWQAYADLEAFNMTMYRPLAPRFGIDPEPGVFVRLRATASVLAARVFTKLTIRSIDGLANRYIHELEALRAAAPEAYDLFFDYVVAQEALQVDFLQDAVAGDYEIVYRKVERFIVANAATAETIIAAAGTGTPMPKQPPKPESTTSPTDTTHPVVD